jgi:hypothetical protein
MGCVVHGTAFAIAVVQADEWVIQSLKSYEKADLFCT